MDWQRPKEIYTSSCSYKYQCPSCKKIVYFNHGMNAKRIKSAPRCEYPYCPWCGIKIGEKMKIKLDKYAIAPIRKHDTDAGLDLYLPYDLKMRPYETVKINTGVHVQIPDRCVGLIKSRSSMMDKTFTEGVIDAGYTGEISVVLHNITYAPLEFKRGDRIAQLLVLYCEFPTAEIVDALDESDRGNGGFGSTGK